MAEQVKIVAGRNGWFLCLSKDLLRHRQGCGIEVLGERLHAFWGNHQTLFSLDCDPGYRVAPITSGLEPEDEAYAHTKLRAVEKLLLSLPGVKLVESDGRVRLAISERLLGCLNGIRGPVVLGESLHPAWGWQRDTDPGYRSLDIFRIDSPDSPAVMGYVQRELESVRQLFKDLGIE